MSKDTVEVPIAWLNKLLELGKVTEVRIYSSGIANGWTADKSKLEHLKGYIESAKMFTKEEVKD